MPSTALLLLLLAAGASAETVAVDPSRTRGRISRELLGTNLLYAFEGEARWADGKSAAALKDMGIGFLRYPGGAVTAYWHWDSKTMIGGGWADSDPWDPANAGQPAVPASEWMSLDEYLVQAKAAGANPLVGVNIESGIRFNRQHQSLQKAVELVRYAGARGVKHYFIGNEPYHHTATPRDLELSASHYARVINTYADAMRAVDPDIKIVANWENSWRNSWKDLLAAAGRNIDYVDLHVYWRYDHARFDDWKGTALMEHLGDTYTEKLERFRSELGKLGSSAKIAMFEWNIGPSTSTTSTVGRPSEYQAALMNAETLMQLIHGRLDAAAFFPLRWSPKNKNYPVLEKRTLFTAPEPADSPIYRMLRLYTDVLGDSLLAGTTFQPGLLSLAAHDASSKTTTVFLLNKTGADKVVTLSLGTLIDPDDGNFIRALAFRAPNRDLASETAEVVEIPYVLDPAARTVRVSVRAYSLTRVTVDAAPQATTIEDVGSTRANIRFNAVPGLTTRILYQAAGQAAAETAWKDGTVCSCYSCYHEFDEDGRATGPRLPYGLYSHSLTGLSPGTQYTARIQYRRADGAATLPRVLQFTTTGARVVRRGRTGSMAFFPNKMRMENVARLFDLHGELGVQKMRIPIRWRENEPTKGSYTFTSSGYPIDDLIEFARRNNIQLMATLAVTPKWASSCPDEAETVTDWGHAACPPRDHADFAAFVSTMAARFKGRIPYWEIWNEPNLRKYWHGTPQEYVRLLRTAHAAIKAQDPDAVVGSAGLSSYARFENGRYQSDFLEGMIAERFQDHCDAVGYHAYKKDAETDFEFVRDIRERLDQAGITEPLRLTEIGWSGGVCNDQVRALPPHVGKRDHQARAVALASAYERLTQFTPAQVEAVMWYTGAFDYSRGEYGLIRWEPPGEPSVTPAYTAYKDLIVNQPPAFSATADQTGVVGRRLSFLVRASDPDRDVLILSTASALPAGASFTDLRDGTGRFSWTPSPSQTGERTLRFRVSDGLASAAADVSVRVAPRPTLSVRASDAEASEDGDPGRFTVRRDTGTAEELVVWYALSGTASNGTDYARLASSAVFAAGRAWVAVDVLPIDDAVVEGTETVVLALSPRSHYEIGAASRAVVRIEDDEETPPEPVLTVRASDSSASEDGDPGRFTLSRGTQTEAELTVWFTLSGSAAEGVDYAALPSSAVFPVGRSWAAIDVRPIDDAVSEGTETVVLALSPRSHYEIGAASRAVVTIADDDRDPPDAEGPSVRISSPADSARVRGRVPVEVEAADPSGVARVQLYVDGSPAGTDSSAPYRFILDTTALTDGRRRISARAVDGAGNAAESSIEVVVANPRRLEILPAGSTIEVGPLKVRVPPGAVDAPTAVSVYDEVDDPEAPARLEQARGQGLARSASAGMRFDPIGVRLRRPASVEVRLSARPAAAQTVALFAWDPDAQVWRMLPSEADLAAGVVRAEASSLTVLKAFEAAPSAGAGEVGEVFVFPNPAKRGARPTIHVQCGSAERVEIKIYDLAGERVHEASLSGAPILVDRGGFRLAYEYAWDAAGAASGVYLYSVTVHGGGKTTRTGKFAVIH